MNVVTKKCFKNAQKEKLVFLYLYIRENCPETSTTIDKKSNADEDDCCCCLCPKKARKKHVTIKLDVTRIIKVRFDGVLLLLEIFFHNREQWNIFSIFVQHSLFFISSFCFV